MYETDQQQSFQKYLTPANPIITKQITEPPIKLIQKQIFNQLKSTSLPIATKKTENQEQNNCQEVDKLTLLNAYCGKDMIFKKIDNSNCNERYNKRYFSSVFCEIANLPSSSTKPFVKEVNGLKFSSDGESMNLFAVFQSGPQEFDLILQNDINTIGYTQWFYFSISNVSKNQTIKINIVNLYKTKSLYSSGMKPLAFSKKLGKWQRTGTNINYYESEINMEHSKKMYHTLSFQHTFLNENNQTLFAHSFPYTYTTLKWKLKAMQKFERVKIKTIGLTAMKKPIPLVCFSNQNNNHNKKAIIILARQHPGETVGSLIMDEIMNELSKNSVQIQFLLWRFKIFCVPMVNIDGVVVGNYRGNAYGYDLNRCWDRQNNKLPEIKCIKQQIKNIQKKYQIEMILDLHGHSRKMGSFFYGNPFGKNTGLFAYIASKASQHISLQDSTFKQEKTEKISTARMVLGNMIKNAGSFYTYETSFYGGISNNRKVHFTHENYQELGKVLVSSLYKTFMEIQKEEKTLKETIYLKDARKQIENIQSSKNTDNNGSDSQAEEQTIQEMKVKAEEQKISKTVPCIKEISIEQRSQRKKSIMKSISIQVGDLQNQLIEPVFSDKKIDLSDKNTKSQLFCRNTKKLGRLDNLQKIQKSSVIINFQKSEDLAFTPVKRQIQSSRKSFLMQKLRVFGQTFREPFDSKQNNKQTQVGDSSFINLKPTALNLLTPPILKQVSPTKTQYRRKKNRNRSLIIKMEQRSRLPMGQIVKVKRLQCVRMNRELTSQSQKMEQEFKQVLPAIFKG